MSASGRPTSDPKTVSITIRVNEETKNRLEQIALRNGISISDVLRQLIQNGIGY